MEMQRRSLLHDTCEATLLSPLSSSNQCHIQNRCCHNASIMEKVNVLRSLSQAQISLRMPRQRVGRGPCIGGDFRVLRFAVSSATNASMLGILEESVQATVSSPMNSLHMARESMASFSPPFRGSTEEVDMEHFFLFSDSEPLNNDEDQVTKDFLQSFRSIEDLNDHLFRTWWEKVNRGDVDPIEGSINEGHGISDSPRSSTNGSLASCDVERPVAQLSPGHQDLRAHCITEEPGESFLDCEDGISVIRLYDKLESACEPSRFRVLIPKLIMKSMPPPPNDLMSPAESSPDFNIEVRLAELQNPHHVDACIDWLLQDSPDGIALVCKHGSGGSLGLIQLSAHQRCVLIKVSQAVAAKWQYVSLKLRALLSEREIVKVGVNVQKDALALNYFLGITTNSCVRISQFVGTKRRKSLLNLCRELFQWEWSEKKKVCCSNWASKDISLEQVKYAVLDAWTARLVWVGQMEFWHIQPPSFSLGDLPWTLLDYFGRSVFCFELQQTRKGEDTSVEVKGASLELHQGYLSLKQKNFRSRVMGQKSVVEVRFKDGRTPQKYVTLYREGSRVILDSAEPLSMVKSVENIVEEISMISKVLVDNSNNCDVQKQKLEESLYVLLCIPGACPRHILVALGCLHDDSMIIPRRRFSLEDTVVQNCKLGLNPGQLEAWQHMLLSPLSAVVGPPGTGKTTVIAAVARAWLQLAGPGETLVCAAHQNVAVRHMAETMVKERIPGLLLLVSEDFYVGWHEDEYTQDVKEALVVSGSQTNAALQSWLGRNGNAPPRLVLCTLSLIGNDSFHASLMGNTVSSMIIDECSQAAEGSLIPALGSLPHLQMLSVVGDPCQLPPYGLRPMRSVFDLIAQSCSVKQLQEQYRMPYRIAQFVSSEFYGGRLHTDGSKILHDSDGALLWIDVRGTVDATSGTSLSNQEEAEAVVEWCRVWKRTCGGVAPRGKVVVLTLYEAQRSLISGMLGEEGMAEEVIVYNADSFQGQEAEVVLISLVVGARVSGFAADRRRACVLLSRARRELLLFGNLDAIQAQKRPFGNNDNIWMALARYCQGHGWVVSRRHVKSLAKQLCQSP
eukprot:c22921_g1_i1 orf=647-3865(+)